MDEPQNKTKKNNQNKKEEQTTKKSDLKKINEETKKENVNLAKSKEESDSKKENKSTENNKKSESSEKNNKSLIKSKSINKNELDVVKNEIKKNKKSKKLNQKKQLKYKEILKNVLIGMLMFVYLIALIIGKNVMSTISYITDLKIIIMVEVVISLIIFEIAYSKDAFIIGIHGIETLTLSGLTILILDLCNKKNESLWLVFSIITGITLFYYLIKILVISLKPKMFDFSAK